MSIRSIIGIGKVTRMSGKVVNINVNHSNAKELGIHNAEDNTINAIIVPSFNMPIVFVYDERNKVYKTP
ncbi:hypothetical protein [Caldivirga maquilingensis]|nr:hypothetical protein [Caldivirga maquilingensis]